LQPNRIRTQLYDILSRPEYNRVFAPKPNLELWQKFWDWVNSIIGKLFGAFRFGGGTTGKIASFVFACLVIIAFAILLGLIIKKLTESNRGRKDIDSLDFENYDLPSARPLIMEADKLAQAGDYRGAFKCAYLASISYLDEIRALRFERSSTNWEYLRELENGGFETPYGELKPLTIDFDRMFYGREACNRQKYECALSAFERITEFKSQI
jgi:hypothetical protein